MKIYIFTNKDGKIIGSYQPTSEKDEETTLTFDPTYNPDSNVIVHERELPSHLHSDTSAKELYEELPKLLDDKAS